MRRGQAVALVLESLAALVTAVASAREKTQPAFPIGRDHKLVGRRIGTRGGDEGPTRELIEPLLTAP